MITVETYTIACQNLRELQLSNNYCIGRQRVLGPRTNLSHWGVTMQKDRISTHFVVIGDLPFATRPSFFHYTRYAAEI